LQAERSLLEHWNRFEFYINGITIIVVLFFLLTSISLYRNI